MENILKIIEESFENKIIKAIISSPFKKSAEYKRIVVENIIIKNENVHRFSMYFENKVKHINTFTKEDTMAEFKTILEAGYKQWDIHTSEKSIKIIMNKKYNYKMTHIENENIRREAVSHNREKNYILKEGEVIPMLQSLGIMNSEGYVLKDKQKKFKQLNKFLEIVKDVLDNIPKDGYIIDFGCGKSYLTFAMYYYLNVVLQKNVHIKGVDLKTDVIEFCNKLAIECKYDKLEFVAGDIMDFEFDKPISMVISLHACDVATDYAINFGVSKNVPVILSVPCCHHELFDQVKNNALTPILKHGILKEKFSSILTDGLRGNLLEIMGYKVNIMEFIDSVHTPKNILIKAIKTSSMKKDEKLEDYMDILRMFDVEPMLYRLLEDKINVENTDS